MKLLNKHLYIFLKMEFINVLHVEERVKWKREIGDYDASDANIFNFKLLTNRNRSILTNSGFFKQN